jgi:hypothetical protein
MTTLFLRDRFRVRDDDDGICADGERVSVPLALMDGQPMTTPARPGFATLDAEQVAARRSARQEMIDRSVTAWRMDARKKPPKDDPDDPDGDEIEHEWEPEFDARAARKAARDGYIARLTDAWRSPVDAAQPDLGTPPDELMRRHLKSDPDDDVAARKERAYQDYTTSLSNAWRNPPGVLPQQSSLVGPGTAGMIRAVSSPDPAARAEAIERLGEKTRGGR